MRIVYAVPGMLDQKELLRRRGLLRQWAFPGTEVELCRVTEGPASIESAYEEYLSVPAAARLMTELEGQGYDAAILGCACDPGLDAMRELTEEMLVVGPGSAAYQAAALLGNRFAVLTIDRSLMESCRRLGWQAGCGEKLGAVVPIDIPVLELARDRGATVERLAALGRRLVEEQKADVLVLGCMSLGFLDVAEELTAEVGIPCINPAKTGLKLAEALVSAGLRHSKAAYPMPPKLRGGTRLDALYVRPETGTL